MHVFGMEEAPPPALLVATIFQTIDSRSQFAKEGGESAVCSSSEGIIIMFV